MLLSKCAVCNSRKSKFFIEQEARGLLSKFIGVKVPILHNVLMANTFFKMYKMNTTLNKILLAGDKFTTEMHLKQP